MSHYCTFFDRGYLPEGLALWHSLQRHEPEAKLWVLALDEGAAAGLRAGTAPGLHVVSLTELLVVDPALAAARAGRSRSEFAFTLKPCLCRYLLRRKSGIEVLTYLDADVYFFGYPGAIQRELGTRSVFLVPHRYPPWHDDRAYYGCFNAGILAFRDDATGRACLERWREQCLASCALVNSGAVYGDQKYLDEWPECYGAAVCVSENAGLNFAPWNWARHACAITSDGVQVDGQPLVAYHFAQFRRVSRRWFDSGQLEYGVMPLRLRSRIYGEYWAALVAAETAIGAVIRDYVLSERGWASSLGPWHLALLRLFWGQFWLRVGPWWLAGRLGFGRFSGHALARYRGRRRMA